ncbi:hypothetical protein [Patiriisocius marinus]|uniref:hypothetical protein n=1 Tax=Patiriisocius marinus TaxID=1397112 RepID=UPI00232D1E3D|nr:hypothetical protein [Patiriisocius marinus]
MRVQNNNEDRFYTETGTEITKKVEEGRTNIVMGISWDSEKVATEQANTRGTYMYPVYDKVNNRLNQIGYGVPM